MKLAQLAKAYPSLKKLANQEMTLTTLTEFATLLYSLSEPMERIMKNGGILESEMEDEIDVKPCVIGREESIRLSYADLVALDGIIVLEGDKYA